LTLTFFKFSCRLNSDEPGPDETIGEGLHNRRFSHLGSVLPNSFADSWIESLIAIPGCTIVLMLILPGTSSTRYNPQKDNTKVNSQQGYDIFLLQNTGMKRGTPPPVKET
jgi:hypothetical protein